MPGGPPGKGGPASGSAGPRALLAHEAGCGGIAAGGGGGVECVGAIMCGGRAEEEEEEEEEEETGSGREETEDGWGAAGRGCADGLYSKSKRQH